VKRDRPALAVFVLIGVAVLLLSLVGLLRPLENLVAFVLKPVTKVFHLDDSNQANQEVADLKDQVATLQGQLAQREEARLQNDALRAQLGFAQANNYRLAQGRVVGQDPTNYQQVVTIDRGSSGGISKGMVAVSGGLLVGKVIDTTTSTAKVYLITDFNSAVPALDQQTRASGVVQGTRGYGLTLEMVQQTDQLKSGDTLVTSGFGGDYPAGLVVGVIGDIKRRDTDVFQTAQVRPAVDFRKLESVYIILGTT